MLFRRDVLERIQRGDVTLAFRRWKRPSVRAGGTLRTAVGVVKIGTISEVPDSSITPAEANAAGYESVRILRAELDARPEGRVYRIELGYAGADPRIALRNEDTLTATDLAGIRKRLDRLDRACPEGSWTVAMLRLVASHEGIRAADLAARVGQEKEPFKINVRKLKNIGLTESLDVGYRLSPRGRCLLEALDKEARDNG